MGYEDDPLNAFEYDHVDQVMIEIHEFLYHYEFPMAKHLVNKFPLTSTWYTLSPHDKKQYVLTLVDRFDLANVDTQKHALTSLWLLFVYPIIQNEKTFDRILKRIRQVQQTFQECGVFSVLKHLCRHYTMHILESEATKQSVHALELTCNILFVHMIIGIDDEQLCAWVGDDFVVFLILTAASFSYPNASQLPIFKLTSLLRLSLLMHKWHEFGNGPPLVQHPKCRIQQLEAYATTQCDEQILAELNAAIYPTIHDMGKNIYSHGQIFSTVHEGEPLVYSEHVFSQILPHLNAVAVNLLKLLLACFQPDSSFDLKSNLEFRFNDSENQYMPLTPEDTRKHTETLTKSVLGSMLLLITLLKRQHPCHSEFLVLKLIASHSSVLLCKILKSFSPSNIYACPNNYDKVQSDNPTGHWTAERLIMWRNVYSTITCMRLLLKLSKHRPNMLKSLVSYHVPETLDNILSIFPEKFHLYPCKLFKQLMPFLDQSWRRQNMNIISKIYQYCRIDYLDDWLTHSTENLNDNDVSTFVLEFIEWHYTQWWAYHRVDDNIPPLLRPPQSLDESITVLL